MTDEKNQGAGSGKTAAEQLAQQRKELNLQTQPLEVIADLDWDVDDDDAEFTLPTPTVASTPKKTEPAAESKKTSSGTMAMSASEFADAMKEETAKSEAATESAKAQASQAANAAKEQAEAATQAAKDVVDTAPHVQSDDSAATSSGGTMLLSGDAMKEAMEAAKIEAESTGAEHRETAPHAAVEGSDGDAPQRSASGTMLMSADAVQEELEKQSGSEETTAQSGVAATGSQTGSVEDATTPAHEPQAPDWSDEASEREAAAWTAPADSSVDSPAAGGFLSNLPPNTRVVLAITAVIVLVIIVWLIFK